MLKPTERFSDRVENYIKYRPSYPVDLVTDIASRCQLHQQSAIADIGSGTGKLAEVFLRQGYSVTGVEPNREMRQAAEQLLSANRVFTSVKGTAEDSCLTDDSVDLIVAGQAFHWFDQESARKEFDRVMKPGGNIALIWNERAVDQPFQRDYDAMLSQYCEEYDLSNHRNISDVDIQRFCAPQEVTKLIYAYHQNFDLTGFLGRMFSSSYTPVVGTSAYATLRSAATELFEQYQCNGVLDFEYATHVYLTGNH